MAALNQRILPLAASPNEQHPTIHTPVPLSRVREDPADRALARISLSARSYDASIMDLADGGGASLGKLIDAYGPAVLGERVMHRTDGVLPFSIRHVATRSVADEVERLRQDIAAIRSCYAYNPAFRDRLERTRKTTDEEIARNGIFAVAGAMETVDALWDVPQAWRTQVQLEEAIERIMVAGTSVYMSDRVRDHGAGGDEIWMILDADANGGFLMWDDERLEGEDFSGGGFRAFSDLQFVPARPRELYYIPAGAVHAVTAGVHALVATAEPSISSEIYSMYKIRGDRMIDGRYYKPDAKPLDHSHFFSAQIMPFGELPDRHGGKPVRIKRLNANGVSMSTLLFPRGISSIVRVETGGDVAAVTVLGGQATILADDGEVKHPGGGCSALVIPGTPAATSFGLMSMGVTPTSVLLTSMEPVTFSAAAFGR